MPVRPIPVCTSSRIRRAPTRSQAARAATRYSSLSGMDAALAHDRLQEDGAGRIGDRLVELVDVVRRHVVEARRQRGERGLVLRLPGRGQRAERSTMERAGQRHELVRAALAAVASRQLERCLVRLGARVGEEDAVERGPRDERLCQLELGERVVEVRDLDERGSLARDRLGDGRMRVAQHVDGDPGHEVEVLAAGIIGHPAAVAAHQRQRLARVGLEVDPRLARRRVGRGPHAAHSCSSMAWPAPLRAGHGTRSACRTSGTSPIASSAKPWRAK